MQNTQSNPGDVNQVINKMQMIKFKGVFMAALDLVKKDPVNLIAIFLAPMLVNAVIVSFVVPPITNAVMSSIGGQTGVIVGIVLQVVFGILTSLIGFFGFSLLVRSLSQVYAGQKADIGKNVSFVQQYFVDGIKLAIKLFMYTGSWILIAYGLVALLISAVSPVGIMLLGFFPIAALIYIILYFKKIVSASMSYAVFWSSEKPEVAGALQKSISLAEGLIWTLVGNYFLMGLVGGIVSAIAVGILAAILMGIGPETAANIASYIISGFVGTFYAAFQYCLKGQVEKFRASK